MRLKDADAFMAEMRYWVSKMGWDENDVRFSLKDIEMNLDIVPTIEAQIIVKKPEVENEC